MTVKEDLSLAFGNDAITREGLKTALDTKMKGNVDERVFVRADKTVDYGDLMEAMNLLRNAGYLKIGLENLPPADPAAGIRGAMIAGEHEREPVRQLMLRWALSVMFVLAVHSGVAFAIVYWPNHETPAGEPPSAVMIELSPLPVAPDVPP